MRQVRWLDPVHFALSYIRRALGDWHTLRYDVSTRVSNIHHILHAMIQCLRFVSRDRSLAFLELAPARRLIPLRCLQAVGQAALGRLKRATMFLADVDSRVGSCGDHASVVLRVAHFIFELQAWASLGRIQ